MAIKHTLQLRQAQTLALTPQLQQAIRMLQLSTLELREEIQQALDSNPFLEVNEEVENPQEKSLEEFTKEESSASDDFNPFDNDSSINVADASLSNEISLNEDGDIKSDLSNLEHNEVKDSYESLSDNYTQNSRSSKALSIDDDSIYEGHTQETLHDHLMLQLECSPLTGCDKEIAITIIDAINDSGYLTESLESILDVVQRKYEDCTIEDVNIVLKVIQHYDPFGVGSRNIQEFLLLQLKELPNSNIYKKNAIRIIEEFLPLLTNRDFRQLCQKLTVRESALKEIIATITRLKPRPEITIVKEKSDFIIPDVIAVKNEDGTYRAELNPSAIPAIRVNEQYKQLMVHAKKSEDVQYFKSNLQEANWFLQSINKRNETLLKVANCILEQQQDFMDKGESAMQAMVLNDVASRIEMHESTISRITTEKYIYTPRGTFELKYFFSSHVNTDDGNTASATAIRSYIKDLIAKENPRKPLSDNKIAEELQNRGIMVARRTIAKYRESIGIASSSQRKRLI